MQIGKENIAIIAIFVLLAASIVGVIHYGTKTLSASRSYISAADLWTKSQKEAVELLYKYSIEKKESLYKQFQKELKLLKSFMKTRKILISNNYPDYDLVFKSFRKAQLHPKDKKLIIWFAQYKEEIPMLQKAFKIWKKGDQLVVELERLGRALHQAIQKGQLDKETRIQFLREISSHDQTSTKIESSLSATIAKVSRWLREMLYGVTIILSAVTIIVGFVINKLYENINELNQELSESKTKFKTVLNNSRDIIYQLDFESGNYQYISPAMERILGYWPNKILKKGPGFIIDLIHPEDRKRMDQEIKEMKGIGVQDHFSSELEYRIRTKEGDYIWINNKRTLIRDSNGTPTATVGTARDVTTRREQEVQMQKALEEKQTLLKEIHHRVKNNLAVITSLLELQKDEASGEVKDILQDVESRIRSIAMIHENLYHSETLSEIDMKEYIERFANLMADSFSSNQKEIIIEKNVPNYKLDVTKALPLGLIVHELLNNAFKHGFVKSKSGYIRITLQEQNGKGVLEVADNGDKLPDYFIIENQNSMGMTLIKTLTKQLEGELEVFQNEWTTFQVSFPIT